MKAFVHYLEEGGRERNHQKNRIKKKNRTTTQTEPLPTYLQNDVAEHPTACRERVELKTHDNN